MQSLTIISVFVILIFASLGNAQDDNTTNDTVYAVDELSADVREVVYPIELQEGDILIARTIALNADLQPRMTLLDQQLSDMGNSVDQLVVTNVPAGSYMLRVNAQQARFGRFALNTQVIPTRGTAVTLPPGQTLSAPFDEQETRPIAFTVERNPSTALQLEIRSSNLTGTTLVTRAASGSVLAQIDHNGFQTATVTLEPGSGDYHIIVLPGEDSNTVTGNVQLTLRTITSEGEEITCRANGIDGGSNIYAQPNNSAAVIGTLNPGDELPVLARVPSVWYLIEFGEQRGWISILEAQVGGSDCTEAVPRLDPLNQ